MSQSSAITAIRFEKMRIAVDFMLEFHINSELVAVKSGPHHNQVGVLLSSNLTTRWYDVRVNVDEVVEVNAFNGEW